MTIPALEKFKILLIGDDCLDIYQYGTVDRISPEAPVPVFVFKRSTTNAGMAGNVKRNLTALGCDVTYWHGETSTKTRIIDIRSKQQIVRMDDDPESDPLILSESVDGYDAIVISDYNKGTVSYELIDQLKQLFTGPIFIDTKKTDLARFAGCYVKINELEYTRRTSDTDMTIVTLGERGAMYTTASNEWVYPAPVVEVTDVCGAGDTFLAALTVDFLRTQNIKTSVQHAIKAASVTVQHIGCYAPTPKEIK